MKQFTISIRAVLLLLLLLVAVPQAMAQKQGKKPFTVVIDAGHGGEDGGACTYGGLPEKELVKVGIPYMDEMAKRLEKEDK